jgi:hypothetical protein
MAGDRDRSEMSRLAREADEANRQARVWEDEADGCRRAEANALSGPEKEKYRKGGETARRKAADNRRRAQQALAELARLRRGRR